MVSPFAALLALAVSLGIDVIGRGTGRYADRAAMLWTLTGWSILAELAGWQGYAAGWAAGEITLPMLDRPESAALAVIGQVVGSLAAVAAMALINLGLMPSFLARKIPGCRISLAGPAGSRINWRVWALGLSLPLFRPLAWGPVKWLADLDTAVTVWVWGEHLWGIGSPRVESSTGQQVIAWCVGTCVLAVLAVAAGWRPDLIVNPYPGAFREWLAAVFPQVNAVGVGGGVGDGEMADDRPADHDDDDVTVEEWAPGVFVGHRPSGNRMQKIPPPAMRFAPRIWLERMIGAPPDVLATAAPEQPPLPDIPGPWWPWLCEAVRAGCRPIDIIRTGKQNYGAATRTWERRIAQAREAIISERKGTAA